MVRPSTCGPLGFLVFWFALFATVVSSASVGLFSNIEPSSTAPSRTVTGYDVNGRDDVFLIPSGVSLVEHLVNTIARFDAAAKAKEEEVLWLRTQATAYMEGMRALHAKEEEMKTLARHRHRQHIWLMSQQHRVCFNDPATMAPHEEIEIDTDSSHPWYSAFWALIKGAVYGLELVYIHYIVCAIWQRLWARMIRKIAAWPTWKKEYQEATSLSSEEPVVPSQHQERTTMEALATTEIEQALKQYQKSTPAPPESAVVPSQQQERTTTAPATTNDIQPTQSEKAIAPTSEAQPAPRRRSGWYGYLDSDEEDEVPAPGEESPAVKVDVPAPTKSRRSKYGIDLEEDLSGGEEKNESARVVQRAEPKHKPRTPRVPPVVLRSLRIALQGPGSFLSQPRVPLQHASPLCSSIIPSSDEASSAEEHREPEQQPEQQVAMQQAEQQPDGASPPSSSVIPSWTSSTSAQEQEMQQQLPEQQVAMQQPQQQRDVASPPSSSVIPSWNDTTSAEEQQQPEMQQPIGQQVEKNPQQQPDPSPQSSSVIPSWNDPQQQQYHRLLQEEQQRQLQQQLQLQQEEQQRQYLQQYHQQQQYQQFQWEQQQQPQYIAENNVFPPGSLQAPYATPSWAGPFPAQAQEHGLGFPVGNSDWTQLASAQEQQAAMSYFAGLPAQQPDLSDLPPWVNAFPAPVQQQGPAYHIEGGGSYPSTSLAAFPNNQPAPNMAELLVAGEIMSSAEMTADPVHAQQNGTPLHFEQQPIFASTDPGSWNVPSPAFDHTRPPHTMSTAPVFVTPEPVATEPVPDAGPDFDWSNIDPQLRDLEPVNWALVDPQFMQANFPVDQDLAPSRLTATEVIHPTLNDPLPLVFPPAPAGPETEEEVNEAADLLLGLVNSFLHTTEPQQVNRPQVNQPRVVFSAEEEAMNVQAAPARAADMGAMGASAHSAYQDVARLMAEAQRQLDGTQTTAPVNPTPIQANFVDQPLAPPPPSSSFRLPIEDLSPTITATGPTYPTLDEPSRLVLPSALAGSESNEEANRAATQSLNLAQSGTSSQQVNQPEGLLSAEEQATNGRSAPSGMGDMRAMEASAEEGRRETERLIEEARQEVQAGSQSQAQPAPATQPSGQSDPTSSASTQTIIGKRKVSTRNTFKPGRPAKASRLSPSQDVSQGSGGSRE